MAGATLFLMFLCSVIIAYAGPQNGQYKLHLYVPTHVKISLFYCHLNVYPDSGVQSLLMVFALVAATIHCHIVVERVLY